MPKPAATSAGHDWSVRNTAPLDRPWVSESPTVTKAWSGEAARGGASGDGGPNSSPSVGSSMGGRTVSVTITSGGVWESRYSGGSWDISRSSKVHQSNHWPVSALATSQSLAASSLFVSACELPFGES